MRTASGAAPAATKGSLATTPIPVDRAWDAKAERLQGSGSRIQRWKPCGSASTRCRGRRSAARACRAIDSRRMKPRISSAVPSWIQRVAKAAVSGGRHHGRGPQARGQRQGGACARRQEIGDAEPGPEAFGETRHVVGHLGRERVEGRWSVGRDEAIGIVFDHHDVVAPRHLDDRLSSRPRHRNRGGIEQRRVEVKRLRGVPHAGGREGSSIDPLAIHGQADELQPEMSRDRAGARIGQVFATQGIARPAQRRQDGEKRAVGARADQQTVGRGRDAAPAEPIQRRLFVVDRAPETLIAEKPHEFGRDRRDPVPHPREELGIVRLGRQVHAEIDQRRAGLGT